MGKAVPPCPKKWEPAHHWHQGQKTMPGVRQGALFRGCISMNQEILPLVTRISQRLAVLSSDAKTDMSKHSSLAIDLETAARPGDG